MRDVDTLGGKKSSRNQVNRSELMLLFIHFVCCNVHTHHSVVRYAVLVLEPCCLAE